MLGHLDAENDLSLEQIVALIDELFCLPNKESWKMFVQAAIYESDCQKVIDLMQSTEVLPKLIEDLTNLTTSLTTQQMSLLPKLMKVFNTVDKTMANFLLRYCKDDDMQSFQSYYIKYSSSVQCGISPKMVNQGLFGTCSYKANQSYINEPSNKMRNEIQKIIYIADHMEYLKPDTARYGTEIRYNQYISDAERTANADLEMIDDELRDLVAMSKQLGAPQFLGISLLG
jgi:uncharacterized protein YfbU (UPF0304 family)